ncbi:hypothetical protein IUY40_14410 [Flavobacterium sp. ALJ2]|uniref:hypothetical protein n=1 Tax=Flavobacterium sp. ALJ2 TaxID=2786960 RepID=UPI00189CECDF|nr:hypothetical protein [Flavobacterium sp. ALJ2]MBF7092726.1 hypothetical protein [Flavobacterium sp. ALJ2]
MKFSKNFYLVIGVLFTIDFFYSLFDTRHSHELFFWDVDLWVYRGYRLLIALVFIKLYFDKKKNEKNQLI